MASVNKVIIIGNCGRDTELKQTSTQTAVCTLSIATTRKMKDRDPETEWHYATLYGRMAEVAAQYVTKGSPVYVEGRLHTRKWTDKQGQQRYATEIVVENFQLLGSRNQDQGQGQAQQSQPAQQSAGTYVSEEDCPF